MFKQFQTLGLVALLVVTPLTTYADITISLTRGFVKKNKDRATISTTFEVNKFHKKPKRIGTESHYADVNFAARDTVVRLPMVAEILNGKLESDTFNFLLGMSEGQSV